MFKYCFAVLLLSISSNSQACKIIQSTIGNEYLISEDCVLTPYNANALESISPSTDYFVQYLFASSFQSYLKIKGDIQSQFTLPIAAQPFNHGYRLLIGPVTTLDDAQQALSELKRRGYRDALIKLYTQSQSSETISLSSINENGTATPDSSITIVMPNMVPIFSLGGSTALLPIYDENYQGKTTHYNETYIGSFTFQQAQAVCHESNSKIANARDYNYMLSNMDFVMKYAVKSQFWLTPNQTVTRIQNQIITKAHRPESYFNVICVTQ
ncbi:SPOR domain-containing protein [Vibrio rumoiensis]|uniref:SPOR domain-containing protein n=1 Tax=Vibrio rumoiensis TaxID=76258 RepID=A0ABW7ITQ7_9VIBR